MPTPLAPADRRAALFAAGSLDAALDQPALLDAEAADPNGLLTPDQLALLRQLRAERRRADRLGIFGQNGDVLIVPGFMGSSLRDTAPGGKGLIWIDPLLFIGQGGSQLAALRLAPLADTPDDDATAGVDISAPGSIPVIYDLLNSVLWANGYNVTVAPFDWRKDLERSATLLADRIRGRLGRPSRPLHVIAHSQGSLVARRAIQLLGPEQARRLVNSLVLLGPASFGTFSAAFAVAGSHESIGMLSSLGVKMPLDIQGVLASFTGLYQLLPWKAGTVHESFDPKQLGGEGFWKVPVDTPRLKKKFRWGESLDTDFFADRTAVILGDLPTCGGVAFDANDQLKPVEAQTVWGDGTVPDLCAVLPGVKAFRARGGEHMKLPLDRTVIGAVLSLLKGKPVRVRADGTLAATAANPLRTESEKAMKRIGVDPPPTLDAPPAPAAIPKTTSAIAVSPPAAAKAPPPADYPTPPHRRLRVFSFDPLLATDLDTLDISTITVKVPWEEPTAGPVGEYLEVVDRDPSSDRFYRPVDLRDPRLAATDGLAPSEADPRFHQQMCYAVGMQTIAAFEKALGRKALWAPRFPRDESGQVVFLSADERYVPRLRIYPHALREANAYYDPDKHALLFGYFPSREQPGGSTPPGGTVFTCLSFDVIAHETTHALLHGLHRYYLNGSNPDVFAFHEAFADIVALLQHFSHPEVLAQQIASARGDFDNTDQLGRMARQFGEALGGHRGALREYVGRTPDPLLYRNTPEAHDRGAILVAAVFRAFVLIYKSRVKDLLRLASGGTGVLPAGDLHPDLVNRLAGEAAKTAEHLLTMCVRALDYVPPVDVTFGEYLRALVTADYELVRDDDRRYRAAVIGAFRDWGIYPAGVTVLDETALRWRPPEVGAMDTLRDVLRTLELDAADHERTRQEQFRRMMKNALTFRRWIDENAAAMKDGGASLGLVVGTDELQGIPRNKDGRPRFEVHSVRRCLRVGPHGQERASVVAELVQRRAGYFDEAVQQAVDAGEWRLPFDTRPAVKKRKAAPPPDFWFRGGGTLVIDPATGEVQYCVRKSVRSDSRLARQREFERTGSLPSLAATYFGDDFRPAFALLHADG